MRFIIVASIAGRILRVFGAAFLAPAAVAALYGEWADVPGFVIGGLFCAAIGQAMVRGSRGAGQDLRRIEALAVVSGVWLMLALLCAVPHVWVGLPPIDALFEAMSGITATGATILTDFETPGRGFFFWRAMTQWLGGMGVIALVLAVLPRLAIGVRQLFFAEAPGPTEENVAPQIRKTAGMLWRFYAGLTAGGGGRAGGGGDAALRRGLPCVHQRGGGRVFAECRVDRRLQQRCDRMDRHRLHVSLRGELRAAVPRAARLPGRAFS